MRWHTAPGRKAAEFGMRERLRRGEAGLDHCSAHGLRKADATIAAENGASDRQLMSICGWRTTKQANVYTKKASDKKLATDATPLISLGQIANEILPLSPLVESSGRKQAKLPNKSKAEIANGAQGRGCFS